MCGVEKNVDDFTVEKYKNTIKFKRCKKCITEKSKKYQKTINGFISTTFSRQKHFSIMRNMAPPEYTKLELAQYLKSSVFFMSLYKGWVESGYDKWLRPSIDRINDFLPYSFGNIIVATWRENFEKQIYDTRNATGTSGLKCKAITQISLDGQIINEFHSISEARRQTGITGIDQALANSNHTAGGYKWAYKKDEAKDSLIKTRIPRKAMRKILKKEPVVLDLSGIIDTTGLDLRTHI